MTSEKGVSIYITLIIMTALLGIGMGVSSILIRQVQTFKDVGDSVFAFYAADAGIERLLQVDTCIIEGDEAARLTCIQNTIEDITFVDPACDDGVMPMEADDPDTCRENAIAAIPAASLMLSNGSLYSFVIKKGNPPNVFCPGANYCGEVTGTFEQALRRIEISR